MATPRRRISSGSTFETRPAATMMICGLLDPRMLIEIEITAQLAATR